MDGEDDPEEGGLVDQHLLDCADCRSWLVAAESVTRALRIQPAFAVPDLTGAILTARAERAPKWRMPKLPWLRIALAWVGFAQLVFGIAQMLVDLQVSTPSVALHAFSEGGAWNVAAGVGFLYAAWRTTATVGLLPMLTPFAVLVLAVTAYDIVDGAIKPMHAFAHSLLLLGLALLYFVHRQAKRSGAPSPHGVKSGDVGVLDAAGGSGTRVGAPTQSGGSGRHLRPAGRAA